MISQIHTISKKCLQWSLLWFFSLVLLSLSLFCILLDIPSASQLKSKLRLMKAATTRYISHFWKSSGCLFFHFGPILLAVICHVSGSGFLGGCFAFFLLGSPGGPPIVCAVPPPGPQLSPGPIKDAESSPCSVQTPAQDSDVSGRASHQRNANARVLLWLRVGGGAFRWHFMNYFISGHRRYKITTEDFL